MGVTILKSRDQLRYAINRLLILTILKYSLHEVKLVKQVNRMVHFLVPAGCNVMQEKCVLLSPKPLVLLGRM